MLVPIFVASAGAKGAICRKPAPEKGGIRLCKDYGIGHAIFPVLAFPSQDSGIFQQIIETAMYQHIGIEIDAAMFDKLLEPDHIRLMGNMAQRTSEYFLWRLHFRDAHQWPAQFPPGARRLELAMEIDFLRPDPLDGALQADMMNEAPGLAAKIAGHAEGVMQNPGYACHDERHPD